LSASLLAGINGSTSTYEPTGGNGMLLIGADPENATANELDPYRAEALRAQGFEVTTNDATDNTDIDPDSQDAVIANPPFGSVKGPDGKPVKVSVDGYKIGQIDHLIAAKALAAMKEDGKATLILGANKVTGGLSTDDRIFLNWLYSHYNVTVHFEVDGDLYNRQGAGWPVRVIAINGRQASDKVAPEEGTIQRVDSWEGVYEQLNRGLEAQKRADSDRGASGSVQRKPQGNEPRPVRNPAGIPARGSGSGGSRSGEARPVRQSGEQPRPVRDSDRQSAPGLPVTDSAIRPDADIAQSDRLEQPRGESKPRTERPAELKGNNRSHPKLDTGNEFQAPYSPASSKKDEGILIPTNMRQPLEQAMLKLEDKVGDIDEFARKELGYDTTAEMHEALMGLQVDAIAGAIQQIKEGKGTIIADQTGIGKGRQAAAMIRWAERQGHIPVFVTVKPQLFTDMYGDLSDIGSSDIQPFIVNVDESITLPNGKKVFKNTPNSHRMTLEHIRNTRELPEDRNAMFLTYSQINTDNLQRQVVSSIAGKAVFILDESHSAGGDSSTGDFVKGILQNAAGVTYLSATYAKRPDNMPLYFKTDIGKAIGDDNTLQQAMSAGGLPLQTVVSNNLVKAGQMFRRERSYDGVDIHTKVATKQRAEHTKLANTVTKALRSIVKADKNFHNSYVKSVQNKLKKEGKAAQGAGNKASQSVSHAEFSSVVHNFVRQMLLGLKADVAANEAIARSSAAKSPSSRLRTRWAHSCRSTPATTGSRSASRSRILITGRSSRARSTVRAISSSPTSGATRAARRSKSTNWTTKAGRCTGTRKTHRQARD
jgi:hypothetical protein